MVSQLAVELEQAGRWRHRGVGRLRAPSLRSLAGGHLGQNAVAERLEHEAPQRRKGADRANERGS